jgi:hypothetical protein
MCCCCCCPQVFAAWHNRKRMDREAKRAAEAEDRKKKVCNEGVSIALMLAAQSRCLSQKRCADCFSPEHGVSCSVVYGPGSCCDALTCLLSCTLLGYVHTPCVALCWRCSADPCTLLTLLCCAVLAAAGSVEWP